MPKKKILTRSGAEEALDRGAIVLPDGISRTEYLNLHTVPDEVEEPEVFYPGGEVPGDLTVEVTTIGGDAA